MKLYLEKNDGTKIELKEVETIGKECDIVLLMLKVRLNPIDQEKIEEIMSEKMGKKCVVLDSMVDRVIGM